jgi:Ser/Thr protein kinase RdoA (MazF antagonist)
MVRYSGWPHAESQVWLVGGEREAFLKVLRQRQKFVQERRAYHHWVPLLGNVPRLIAEDEGRQALLVSAVSGSVLEHTSLSKAQLSAAYVQAGAFLRSLHDLPYTDDAPVSLPEAHRQRARGWVSKAGNYVDRDVCRWVLRQVDETADILNVLDVRRVPCHRDYSGRNWLVNVVGESLELSVIDFEHARPDFWLSDVEKLDQDGWGEGLEAAFWRGYGKEPTTDERALLEKLGVLASFTTIVWAREHRDAPFEAKGWERLRDLRARLG